MVMLKCYYTDFSSMWISNQQLRLADTFLQVIVLCLAL